MGRVPAQWILLEGPNRSASNRGGGSVGELGLISWPGSGPLEKQKNSDHLDNAVYGSRQERTKE